MEEHINRFNKMIDFIEENLENSLNVESLAGQFGVSTFHFQRLFKTYIGVSIGQYIKGRRLTNSARLLLETDLNILDIAIINGFHTNEGFSRAFKAHFNMVPKEFRKNATTLHLSNRPYLTMKNLEYLKDGITREPEIKFEQDKFIRGWASATPNPFESEKDFGRESMNSWYGLAQNFSKMLKKEEYDYFGIPITLSGEYTEKSITFIAGFESTNELEIPDSFISYNLKGGMRAYFEILDLSESKTKVTLDYIYGYWLGNSEFKRTIGDDYLFIKNLRDLSLDGYKAFYTIPIERRVRGEH